MPAEPDDELLLELELDELELDDEACPLDELDDELELLEDDELDDDDEDDDELDGVVLKLLRI